MTGDVGLRAWAEALRSWGIVLMRNAPAGPEKLLEIARHAGPIRSSNFGDHYDVISMPNPNASAYTAMVLNCTPTSPIGDGLPITSCCSACATMR